VVGGAAYAAGKHRAAKEAAESAQAEPPPAQPEQAAPSAPAGSTGLSPEGLDQIKQLAQLRDQGVLTNEEFASEKAKLLGS